MRGIRLGPLSVALLAATAVVSCVTEKTVYPDKNTPPTAAANFVGYSNTTAKQTTCGNCHVDQQTQWSQTKHASAWADLLASGHSTEACENCHTVSKLGNAAITDVGYSTTKDARYHDVQCESCHGAGLTHVTAPSLSNRLLASIAVDTGTANTNGCGECHTGTHEPFVDEWKASPHSHIESAAVSNFVSGSDATCVGCHTAQGALAKWGINTNYREKDQLATNAQALTCTTCHDPHSAAKGPAQLRFALNTTDTSTNLCMKCHQRRAVPDQASSRGPHSPEGEALLGIAGWFPPNMAGTKVLSSSHGDPSRNTKLCATCHVARFAVNDPKTGSFMFQATGHLFNATPCLNAQGLPTTADCSDAQKTYAACTGSGCHSSEAVARSAKFTADQRVASLITTLTAMISKIPKTEFKTGDNKITTGEGAQFNVALAQEPGTAVHNPFLIESLLTASIKQITTDYGIAASSLIPLDIVLPHAAR
jgi:predicted CXXCH cytochrome family protein